MNNKLTEVFSSKSMRQSRAVMLSVTVTALLIIAFIGVSSQTVFSYNEMQEIEARNQEMQKTIHDWENKVAYINKQEYRPVMEDQVGSITSDILISAQNHQLAMTDFKAAVPANKKELYERTYTLSINGTYENTIAFLTTFHARDALINILSLKMQPVNGLIKTEIKYRVYIKK